MERRAACHRLRPSAWWLKLPTDKFGILHLQAHQRMGTGCRALVKLRR
jgi:hypothetical protein